MRFFSQQRPAAPGGLENASHTETQSHALWFQKLERALRLQRRSYSSAADVPTRPRRPPGGYMMCQPPGPHLIDPRRHTDPRRTLGARTNFGAEMRHQTPEAATQKPQAPHRPQAHPGREIGLLRGSGAPNLQRDTHPPAASSSPAVACHGAGHPIRRLAKGVFYGNVPPSDGFGHDVVGLACHDGRRSASFRRLTGNGVRFAGDGGLEACHISAARGVAVASYPILDPNIDPNQGLTWTFRGAAVIALRDPIGAHFSFQRVALPRRKRAHF